MNSEMFFSGETIAGFIIAGIICILAPIVLLIIYKRRNKDIKISRFFIGAAAFILFALVLEQICHCFMLPLVQNSVVLYCIYGTLAAGIFEETARFVTFRTLMKKDGPRSAIMYGIGHGGIEAIILVGFSMLSSAVMAFSVNTMGADEFSMISAAGNAETAALVRSQLDMLAEIDAFSIMLSVWERVVAVSFHIALSVVVFEAASTKGKIWLYPCAILMHAALNTPAALYQQQQLSMPVTEVLITIIAAVFITVAVFSFRRQISAYNAERENTDNSVSIAAETEIS